MGGKNGPNGNGGGGGGGGGAGGGSGNGPGNGSLNSSICNSVLTNATTASNSLSQQQQQLQAKYIKSKRHQSRYTNLQHSGHDSSSYLHLNSLWSIWYGVLLTLFQGYLAMHGAYRFLGKFAKIVFELISIIIYLFLLNPLKKTYFNGFQFNRFSVLAILCIN